MKPIDVLRMARPAAGGGGGHRYWRVLVGSSNGASATTIGEVEFRTAVGGSSVATGGTAIHGGSGAGGTPALAFDGSTATQWDRSATSGCWIGYDFGTPKDIIEFALQAGNAGVSANNMPLTFKLQWSDDNSSWTDDTGAAAGTFTVADWIVDQTRVFPETLASGFHRYWRLMCLTQNGGTSQFRINEIELRATSGGADQTVNVGDGLNTSSGRIIMTSGDSTNGNAFDNTFDDYWYGQGASNRFIGQVFLSPIKVEEILVNCNTQTTANTPATAEVQFSDDGVSWTNQKSITFGAWTSGVSQVFAAM